MKKEISYEKKKFLESLGIDINNLPPEFEKYSDSIEKTLSKEEIDFVKRTELTGIYNKTFCLKDLVGTVHPDYADKTWIEAFLESKRGDSAVKQYFSNPNYYSTDLKQQNQTELGHDSPIELYESEGRFFINGGNNRLSLIMMKYLAEMSKAQTEEERKKINEEYTFVAEVQPVPEDKDIMYMIKMIEHTYGDKVRIKRTADNDKDCKYEIQLEDRTINISNKEELEQELRNSYGIENVESVDELQKKLTDLIQDEIIYGVRTDQNRSRILNSTFPELQQFKDNFIKLKEYRIEDKLYEEINLQDINLSELFSKANQIVEREKSKKNEEQQQQEEKKLKDEKTKDEEQTKKDAAIEIKKEYISYQASTIPKSVEKTYYELKQEEKKFSGVATKLGLRYSITRTDDTNIYSSIEQIKNNMQKVTEQVQIVDDITKLDKVSRVFLELESLTQDATIKTEYSRQLKDNFERSFDSKVQELIKNSKMSKLEQEKGQIENQKISIIGRLLGKGRLKQARLDNIDLKMQLLMSEKPSEKLSYSLEDSLSDLYAYSQCELGKELTPEMKDFLNGVKANPQLSQMIEQQQLRQKFDEKVNNRQSETQLITTGKNGRISSRHQANMLQLQNNELTRQIQNNRARTVTRQNEISSSININSSNPLCRFQNIVNEIKLSTQIKENKQQQKTEQENEMQI